MFDEPFDCPRCWRAFGTKSVGFGKCQGQKSLISEQDSLANRHQEAMGTDRSLSRETEMVSLPRHDVTCDVVGARDAWPAEGGAIM